MCKRSVWLFAGRLWFLKLFGLVNLETSCLAGCSNAAPSPAAGSEPEAHSGRSHDLGS